MKAPIHIHLEISLDAVNKFMSFFGIRPFTLDELQRVNQAIVPAASVLKEEFQIHEPAVRTPDYELTSAGGFNLGDLVCFKNTLEPMGKIQKLTALNAVIDCGITVPYAYIEKYSAKETLTVTLPPGTKARPFVAGEEVAAKLDGTPFFPAIVVDCEMFAGVWAVRVRDELSGKEYTVPEHQVRKTK